ncbi:FAD/NAD(P)-binding protein [Persicitalea jodogahamensis]|uniref:FAD-dependent urate hydroxylase HpyO/Asp monooxygenase CreE-like FAD/NAD(P)-binding domain-containing protein n=1 Tax=Persicitalea jodogahamensis TaxID=402147 RepID=A0A8J3DCV9_9BACT|nr:FAD/NAD(P)-binding protein [Persicitalea jodogahamensis]GHB84285.1 hypothetical protein GCM10007390_44400 [Persicitalea jodogahamensis]
MKKIAIIGSGATAIYLLKHLMDNTDVLHEHIEEVAIFEKDDILGMGMPYNPKTTDLCNLSNIASEELPELIIPFADWLQQQDKKTLKNLGLADEKISKSEVYNRLALGQYLQAQYRAIIGKLAEGGIEVRQFPNCEVVDIKYKAERDEVVLKVIDGKKYTFSKVVVATGHVWTEEDDVASGTYASPWPIHKILPKDGTFHNFKIGTLGASLSAFDVVSSLSRKHGKFTTDKDGKMTFHPAKGAEGFSIAMHDAHGWLPNLQYEQEEPIREIYRHVKREEIFAMLDADGYLRLETFFDKVCRPALRKAFKKDKLPDMVEKLADASFTLSDFVETMSDKHEFGNAFEGMRYEMKEAKISVENKKPIHWKEVMDDLMYTLNFHAELMPAEDHLQFRKEVMSFLMNVIAAMPLPSGNLLLALYDAGKLEIVTGRVTVADEHKKGLTTVEVKDGEATYTIDYQMFIHCGGQKPVSLDEYPFKSLVKQGVVRRARATFIGADEAKALLKTNQKDLVFKERGKYYYYTGGLDIDASYRVIGEDGSPNDCIHDITFTHTTGSRPYSYGLQACSATSQILVEAWVKSLEENSEMAGDLKNITEIYEETAEL